jgi:ATP/maltotriose-dependent transcriptional regulator MalT
VRGTLLERLRRLPDAEQQALLTAAVLGRDFRADVLAALLGMEPPEVLAALRRARNLQLVVEDANSGAFRFRHAITREVFYGELLAEEARLLHRRIAERLEAAGGGDEAAFHWWAAGDAERAVPANEAGGDRAASIFAYADAARFYERALGSATADARTRLIEKVAFAFCAVGEMQRARAWCQDGAGALRRSGDAHAAQRLLLWVGRQLYESGEVERALETIELVREEQRSEAPVAMHHTAAMTLAGILSTQGRPAEALAVLDEAAAYPCPPEDIDRFRAHNARGNALCSLADYAGAHAEYTAALGVAETLENVEFQVHALGNAANAAVLTGADALADANYAAALQLAHEHGLQRHGLMLESGAALVALHRGDPQAALLHFRAVNEARSAVAMTLGFAGAIGLRLKGLLEGQPDLDALDAEAALENAIRLRESQAIAIVAGAGARSALERGDAALARMLVERALPELTEPDHAFWLCDAAAEILGGDALVLARELLVRAGPDANAAARAFLTLFDARVTAREGGDAQSAARAAGDAFLALGRPLEAASAFELAGALPQARALYRRHGAQHALRRLEEGPVTAKPATPAASGNGAAAALTRRERQIAEFAARGYASRLIANELGIGERTVETHLAVAYRKLGVKSRTELAALLADSTR